MTRIGSDGDGILITYVSRFGLVRIEEALCGIASA